MFHRIKSVLKLLMVALFKLVFIQKLGDIHISMFLYQKRISFLTLALTIFNKYDNSDEQRQYRK